MPELDFGGKCDLFFTVGMLREALKDYSDDASLSVCGIPGIVTEDPDHRCILLEPMDTDDDYEEDRWYPEPPDMEVEYMDF